MAARPRSARPGASNDELPAIRRRPASAGTRQSAELAGARGSLDQFVIKGTRSISAANGSRWQEEEAYRRSFEGSMISDLGSTMVLGGADGGDGEPVHELQQLLLATREKLEAMEREMTREQRSAKQNHAKVKVLEQKLLHESTEIGKEFEYAQRVALEDQLKTAGKKNRDLRERCKRDRDENVKLKGEVEVLRQIKDAQLVQNALDAQQTAAPPKRAAAAAASRPAEAAQPTRKRPPVAGGGGGSGRRSAAGSRQAG